MTAERPIAVGDKVRLYTFDGGWMVGTVRSLETVAGVERATVQFPASAGRYRPCPAQTLVVATFLLERCR